MLSSPLILPRMIRSYIMSTYGESTELGDFLRKHRSLKPVKLAHDSAQIPRVLYHDAEENPGKPSAWDVALSLHQQSYLTGYTVLSLLGWTEYTPKVIYVNWIRGISEKPPVEIDNEDLQRVAFMPKKKPGPTLVFGGREIVVLSGQVFSNVEKRHLIGWSPHFELPKYALRPRNERLFIDALVGYHYFGGPEIVWNALLAQAREISQDALLQTYQEMGLKYPFANAIGYVLDISLRRSKKVNPWLDLVDRELKFHLFMGDAERRVFVEKWSLYVPKRFHVEG